MRGDICVVKVSGEVPAHIDEQAWQGEEGEESRLVWPMLLDMAYKDVDELYTAESTTCPVSLKVIVEVAVVLWFHKRLACKVH